MALKGQLVSRLRQPIVVFDPRLGSQCVFVRFCCFLVDDSMNAHSLPLAQRYTVSPLAHCRPSVRMFGGPRGTAADLSVCIAAECAMRESSTR